MTINPNDAKWTEENRRRKRNFLRGAVVSLLVGLAALAAFLVSNCQHS